MDDTEIESHVKYYSDRYTSLISVTQAAEIASVPNKTIYHWSSTGLLDAFKSKRGRRVRFGRDQFVRFLLEVSPVPH
jgi:excisionase family DNA binding protein